MYNFSQFLLDSRQIVLYIPVSFVVSAKFIKTDHGLVKMPMKACLVLYMYINAKF